jgi:uncharacterized protein
MKTRIFFATDIHGSDKCWIKFLNAAEYYKANVLILGGDLTSKGFIALLKQQDGSFKTNFRGLDYRMNSEVEVEDVEKKIRAGGFYSYRSTSQELVQYESPEKTRQLMIELAKESLQRWMKIAETKLSGKNIPFYLTGGNDDEFEIDDILRSTSVVQYVEGKIVTIDGEHEMISTGLGNKTPWSCPRDVTEEQLESVIAKMADQVKNMSTCIFNIHVPPYNTRLDDAPELDKTMRMSAANMVPVGSTAVRRCIEKYQPLVTLHGHIHESKGSYKMGKTLCLNPGSAYTDGVLQGVVVDLDGAKIKRFIPVSG